MMKILTVIGHYLPGYKAGGPIRTVANMIDWLGDKFQFYVVTSDRDLGDHRCYQNVERGVWQRVGKAQVIYFPPQELRLLSWKRFLTNIEYDLIYLNSFFFHLSIKTIFLRHISQIPASPVVLAPRGEFSPGALGIKKLKKRAYILAAKALGLYKGAVWQASSKHEVTYIRRWLGKDVSVFIAPNLPPLIHEASPRWDKAEGRLKILFLSRISRMKNLCGALEMLKKGINGKVEFNIYGPIEDKTYWAECQEIMRHLPENIKARYYDSVAYDRVGSVMRAHDLFFLPTLGENFGHVILEAFCAGCPVLISKQTPWRSLEEKGVGWDLPLDRPELFREILQRCVDMDGAEHTRWSKRARAYGMEVAKDEEPVKINRQLFFHVVGIRRN